MKPKAYIGIDPGATGGIAIRIDGSLQCSPMPMNGEEVDVNKIISVIQKVSERFSVVVVVENVHSVFGASAGSNFKFGYTCGMIRASIHASKVPYHPIQPKEWQKLIWTVEDKVFKPKKPAQKNASVDTKATSFAAAKRIFPSVSFLATTRSSKPHDGMVDAALIAEAGRRLNL